MTNEEMQAIAKMCVELVAPLFNEHVIAINNLVGRLSELEERDLGNRVDNLESKLRARNGHG